MSRRTAPKLSNWSPICCLTQSQMFTYWLLFFPLMRILINIYLWSQKTIIPLKMYRGNKSGAGELYWKCRAKPGNFKVEDVFFFLKVMLQSVIKAVAHRERIKSKLCKIIVDKEVAEDLLTPILLLSKTQSMKRMLLYNSLICHFHVTKFKISKSKTSPTS